jgi:hypothetical protein
MGKVKVEEENKDELQKVTQTHHLHSLSPSRPCFLL